MPERIAIKLLSGSDLTFFDTFFKRSNIGNQKAINLNADVFAKQFYPDFAERSLGENVEIPVSVTVFGPRPGKAYKFARSITKKTGYKNWRLNGAAVPDPDNEAGRFDHLQVDDLAVLEFTGDAIPEAVRIIIVSARDARNLRQLEEMGWRHLTVWECSTRGPGRIGLDAVVKAVMRWLDGEGSSELFGIMH